MKVDIRHIKTIDRNTLAFALLIKDTYVSSVVKNYNPYSLQQKLKERGFNFHHSTVKKYVDNLLKNDLAEIKNKHLIVRKLYDKEHPYISVRKHKSKTFKEYTHFVRLAILKRKIKQAEYVYNQKLFIIKKLDNPKNIKEYRLAKRLAKRYNILKVDEKEFNYKQSIKSLAELFNCSVGELYTTIKFLVSQNYLKVKKEIKKITPFFGQKLEIDNYFVWNGWLYSVECNSYQVR